VTTSVPRCEFLALSQAGDSLLSLKMDPRTVLPAEPPVAFSDQLHACDRPAGYLQNAVSSPVLATLRAAGLLPLPPAAAPSHLAVAWHPSACRVAYLSGDKVLTPLLDEASLAGGAPKEAQRSSASPDALQKARRLMYSIPRPLHWRGDPTRGQALRLLAALASLFTASASSGGTLVCAAACRLL